MLDLVNFARRNSTIPMTRDYETIADAVKERLAPDASREQRMQVVVDLLWDHLHEQGVSWVGFYLHVPERDEMVLGPRRDKPACSPIGMHGACGRAFRDDQPRVVRDVRDLGENYVACDPRDQSEVVIPIHDTDGSAIGVLDLDSFEVGSFTDVDTAALTELLCAAGLA